MAKGIIFLKKTEWSLYDPTLSTIVTTPYPASAVVTMDVLNAEELENSIKTVFTANKLAIASVYSVILAKDILFTKEFTRFDLKGEIQKLAATAAPASPQSPTTPAVTPTTPPPPPQMTGAERENAKASQEKDIATFIEHVPFEEVGSKVITLPKNLLVVAANQDLYSAFKSGLKKLHHTIDVVLPDVLFPEVHLESGLTLDAAKIVLTKIDTYRQYNLLQEPVDLTPRFITNTPSNPKKEKKQTIVLIAVFAILFLFMIILYYMMYMRPKPKAAQTPTVLPPLSPVVTVEPTPVASESAAVSTPFSIQIISAASSKTTADALKTTLSNLGAKTVTVSQGLTTVPPKTLIVFSSDISTSDREAVLTAVQKIAPSATSQESTSTTKTISITLGSQ